MFAGGDPVDLHRLVSGGAGVPFTSQDLVVHDLRTGRTVLAEAGLASVPIVSSEGATGSTIGALLQGPGDLVLFESTLPGSLDPATAERNRLHRSLGGDATFVPPGFQLAPEPGFAATLASGLGLLAHLARRSTRSRSAVISSCRARWAASR